MAGRLMPDLRPTHRDTAAVALRVSPSSSRALCRASTRLAKSARRAWVPPTVRPATAASERARPGILARLLGRRG
jgi:hypothetical protein